MFEIWEAKCGQKLTIKAPVMCDKHFVLNDHNYNKKLNKYGKKLNKNAIPSLHCESTTELKDPNLDGLDVFATVSAEQNNNDTTGLDLLANVCEKHNRKSVIVLNSNVKKLDQNKEVFTTETILETPDYSKIKFCSSIGVQCSRSYNVTQRHTNENKILKRTIKKLRKPPKVKQKAMMTYLRNLGHSEVKIRHILNPNQANFRGYTQSDISNALILRNISPAAYEFQRKNKMSPLPSRQTLNKWVKDFKVTEGIQHHIIELLGKKISASSKTWEGEGVIVFDEMSISNRYVYDPRTKRVYGNKSKVQTVLVRSLFSDWKEVVYIGFDTSMTSELLTQIITTCEAAGIKIRACVCDLGTSFISYESLHFLPFYL